MGFNQLLPRSSRGSACINSTEIKNIKVSKVKESKSYIVYFSCNFE